jgi:hypothetical protein
MKIRISLAAAQLVRVKPKGRYMVAQGGQRRSAGNANLWSTTMVGSASAYNLASLGSGAAVQPRN